MAFLKLKIKEIFQNYYILIEANLEIKFPKIWRDEKAVSREKSQERKDQKKEDAGARKGRKVAKYCVFSWFCGSGGLKSRVAKVVGTETSGEIRDKKLCVVVARSRFRSRLSVSDDFWKLQCPKAHANVAQSIFRNQNIKSPRGSDHFWKIKSRKSVC